MKRLAHLCLALLSIATAAAITLQWDPNPASEEVQVYKVYQATNVAGPWTIVGQTTNTTYTTPVPPGRYFWYVTASNFWSESLPSNTVNTPETATKVAPPKVTR